MKNLIKNISEASGLKTLLLEDNLLNPILCYFEDRKDFYILIWSKYSNLLEQLSIDENGHNLDLGINAYIDTIKEYEQVKSFGSIIDFNLSSIVSVELEDLDDQDVLKNVHKIEENYKIAKKYILPYLYADFEKLVNKLENSSVNEIPEKLNYLALLNSNVINSKEDSWYQLLMNLFIKLPFLNYHSGSFGLTTISQLFDEGLSDKQKILLQNINENYAEDLDIDIFITHLQLDRDE
ncbi:hypothetical protein [Chryseobacterium sp.]|uniref:hypothetical protein n=1 Tax=Chryseobacterium sp. TaxID=1871047 RepID=UPI0031DCCCE5